MYSHGVGAGSRESTTVYGHAEILNYDLTPEDFNKNIWCLSHINRISSPSLTHMFTEI